jgi:enoyl-CoA hydratase/carnithine racemase
MDYQHIACDLDGSCLIVTLNRPEKLNAYTGLMGAEIADAFERADTDDNVRAVIVTGAGRAFCAGADVSGGAASFDTTGSHGAGVFASPNPGGGRFVEAIFNCRKPSIAAINGPAVGVGITMTLPMDVRIAARGAKIGFIFARRGLVPEAAAPGFCRNSSACRRPCAGACRGGCSTPTKRAKAGLSAKPSSPRNC